MLPLSTGNTNGCNPISSNCIVWQGPDLNCINVCNGDTISIVLAKIAEFLCNISAATSEIDITQWTQGCIGDPTPATNFVELIQNMINLSCNMSYDLYNEYGIVNNLQEIINQNYNDLLLQINNGGIEGEDGEDGEDGIGIQSIEVEYDEETGLPTGSWIVTYTNNSIWISNDLTGPQGDPGSPGSPGSPGDPGTGFNQQIPLACLGDNTLTGDTVYFDQNALDPDATETDWVALNSGTDFMWFITNNPQAYKVDYLDNINSEGEVLEEGGTDYYSGWAEYIEKMLCCVVRQNGRCGKPGMTEDQYEDDDSMGGGGNSNWKALRDRIIKLERQGGSTRNVPAKILAKCVGDIGKRMELHRFVDALQIDYCALRNAIGGGAEVLKASRSQCINLASEKRLSGEGVMAALPGWVVSPSNLSQSFNNAWMTICDMRTAVVNLQSQVNPSGCTGFVYKPKLNLQKNGSGVVTAVNITFNDCVIPTGFYDCDKARGTKIVIEDASLNSYTHYAQVSNLTKSSLGTTITGLSGRGLDSTSNFKVKMFFCFTDGTHQCESIQEFTLENTSACPTITMSNVGENSVEYSVTGLNVNSKATYEIIISDKNNSTISKQTIKQPTTSIMTGKAAGLAAGTTYNAYAIVTPLTGNVASCTPITFTTSAASCATVSKVSTEYKTAIADLGSTKTTVATYKSGSTTTAWIVGFNPTTGLPEAYKGTDSSEAGIDGEFVLNSTSISDNPTTSINCGNVAYPATGMTTMMNSNENGWQYIDALKANGNTTYYVYVLANTANKSIDQVVFCCDCKPSYVRTKYGDTTTKSTSEAYAPDRHAWYVVQNKKLRIPIDIIGYSTQTDPIKWTATSPLKGETNFVLPTDNGYDSSLGGTVQLEYTPSLSRPPGHIDSVEVYAETDCTKGNAGNRTINTITIPVVDAMFVQGTDTDITVFIDATVVTETEAVVIKTEIDRVKTVLQTNCPTWTGTVNYVPVKGGDYLEYTKGMVDMANGGTGSITVASGFAGVKSLPSYWGAGGSVPSTVYLICFIGKNSNYGPSSLTNGWSNQPTSKYQKNYDELLDILYVNGTARTAWGTDNNCTFAKFDLHQLLIPVVSGSQNESAAAVLQAVGALTGTVLSETGLKGIPTGSVKNPINIDGYIGPNASQMVPYTGTTVGASNSIVGLNELGFSVMPFIDKSYLETDTSYNAAGNQSEFLGNAILRSLGIDSSGMQLTSDTYCPTTFDLVKVMSGTLNATDVVLYGNNGTDPTSCSKAGSAALTASGCVTLYNSTGIQFDPSVPAYLSAAGGNSQAITDQPVDEAWYAQLGSASTNSIRRIAQYDRDGATTGAYWKNEKNVSDC